jgi:uncharacterized membrane protein YhhN
LKYFFLALFIGISVFHILTLIYSLRKLRKISKALLMPALVIYYFFAAEHFLWPVALAGLLGWAGDILLIKQERKIRFMLGILGFLLGHLCYIWSIWQFINTVYYSALAVAIIAGLILAFISIRIIHPQKLFLILSFCYILVLEAVGISSLCLLLYRKDILGAAIFGGSVFFLISDFILAYYSFRHFPRFGHLAVMTTYLIAQAGIIIGLAHI